MITFFPTPYEDELLYSVLGRYHIKSGNISFTATMNDLFGSSNCTASIDLPTNLDNLVGNMPINSRYTVEDLIYNNTLYPYYLAFAPEERAKLIFKSMRGNEGTGIYLKTGVHLTTSKQKYFKYCPQCLKEDKYKYGESYWHRINQIKGVFVCTKHNTLLNESVLPISYYHKKEYVIAKDETWLQRQEEKYFSDKEFIMLLEISKMIEYVLNNKFIHRNSEWFIGQYKNRLMQKGLATSNGVVNMRAFIGEFINYYGKKVLGAFEADLNIDDKTNWLKDMVRVRGISRQPIRHILLSQFLDINIHQLFNEKIEYKPFGDAPWPCLNYVCKNYMKPVIKEVNVKHNSKHNSPIGTFKCSCGFTYVRKGPDKCKEDRLKVGNIKEFGEIWESKLKELILQGHSFKEIERRMGSYNETLKKYAIKLGLSDYVAERCNVIPTINDKLKKEIDIEKRKMNRKKWSELRSEYPEFNVTELRCLDNNLYDWLLKWDKEWLENNLPIKRKRSVEKERIDWQQKDQELFENVKRITEGLLNPDGPPRKITISLIGRTLGIKSYLFSNLSRLPQTKAYIDAIVEDSRTYQLRKAKWAIRELEKEGEEIKFWKVYQKASLQEEFLHEYKDEILELIINSMPKGT